MKQTLSPARDGGSILLSRDRQLCPANKIALYTVVKIDLLCVYLTNSEATGWHGVSMYGKWIQEELWHTSMRTSVKLPEGFFKRFTAMSHSLGYMRFVLLAHWNTPFFNYWMGLLNSSEKQCVWNTLASVLYCMNWSCSRLKVLYDNEGNLVVVLVTNCTNLQLAKANTQMAKRTGNLGNSWGESKQ